MFQAVKSDSALEKLRDDLLALDPVIKATLSTTQAVDLVWGGVKVNALPEGATAVVNHRIAEDRYASFRSPSCSRPCIAREGS